MLNAVYTFFVLTRAQIQRWARVRACARVKLTYAQPETAAHKQLLYVHRVTAVRASLSPTAHASHRVLTFWSRPSPPLIGHPGLNTFPFGCLDKKLHVAANWKKPKKKKEEEKTYE